MRGELAVTSLQIGAQPVETDELGAILHLGGIINLHAIFIVRAIAANGIEAFQSEAQRVNAIMTDGTSLVLAMQFELFAKTRWLHAVFLQLRHVRRRWRSGEAQHGLQQPVATHDRARANGARRLGQNASHPNETAAMIGSDVDLTELLTLHVGNAVILGQALIQEGVVRGEDVLKWAVFADELREKRHGFLVEIATEFGRELGELRSIHTAVVRETVEGEPLSHELLRHGLCLWISEHALGLSSQDFRLQKAAIRSDLAKLPIGNGRPEEVAQARSQLPCGKRVIRTGWSVCWGI